MTNLKSKAEPSKQNGKIMSKLSEYWWLAFVMIVGLSFGTRFYKVRVPAHVCWDETHFGKMGSWYINRTFFFDVHPPLGKMLIAFSGYMTGYEGNFTFEKPGEKYGNIPFAGMRMFCTFLGMCVVPFAFVAIWEMTKSLTAALYSSCLILFDIGILTLSRYILLDPIFMFFMMGTVLGVSKFNSMSHKPFSIQWWCWLFFTGFMMASCISVKFVGLFTVLFVGLNTLEDLWNILGDLRKPFTYTLKHFAARTVGLIVFPTIIYMIYFYIHFSVLNKSGNGDGFFSTAFQAKLIGNSLHNASMPREVAYGAIITLKNHKTGGGYLHSHSHLYPEGLGARQQQITTYSHKDKNNNWLVKPYDKELSNATDTPIIFLKHGDLVRLEHVLTTRNLHSHHKPAPITKKHNQVTGYGDKGIGDANDVWKVTIIGGVDGQVVNTVTSKLKFIHYIQHCVLTTSGKALPKWGYEQQEVTCNSNLRDPNSAWNVEYNEFAKLPNVSFQEYAPGFLEMFIESHAVMFRGNSGLKPKEGEVTSRPWQWPLNYRGQWFSGSGYKVYLLGNPIIWWSNLVFLTLFLFIYCLNVVRYQRGYKDSPQVAKRKSRILHTSLWLFLSWILHYVPFWAMGRVLYYHHYFPAALFNSMLTGVVISYFAESVQFVFKEKLVSNTVYHTINGFFFSAVIYSFYLFSPLTYGMTGSASNEKNSTMYGLRWLQTWEF